jgi:hypothetical protein
MTRRLRFLRVLIAFVNRQSYFTLLIPPYSVRDVRLFAFGWIGPFPSLSVYCSSP